MKVLFVLSGSYPASSTGTNLLNKLLFEGGLINKVEKVDVLCGKEHFQELDEEVFNGMHIYRAWAWTVLPKIDLLATLRNNPLVFVKGLLSKVIMHLHKRINKEMFIDKQASNAFLKRLENICANQYDVLISISGRYYHTDAVMRFCKKTGTRFVFYQVDPCGSSEYFSEKTLKERRDLETQIYSTAYRVITTDLIAKDVKKYMSEALQKKITTLEFPLISQPKCCQKIGVKEEKKYCLFTGSIYGGIRNPEYTIKLFKPYIDNNFVELHFVGVNQKELDTDTNVRCHGVMSIEETMKFVEKADVLINIGNSVLNQVPSKIFDYISTGKPIINVCKNRNCPTLKYLRKYPYAINLFEEGELLEEQQNQLCNFIEEYSGKILKFEYLRSIYEECTPEYCARIFEEIICRR